MRRVKLSKKRQKEMDKIVKWFIYGDDRQGGAVDCISDPHERGMTIAKILSRLACLQEKLTDHIR